MTAKNVSAPSQDMQARLSFIVAACEKDKCLV